MRNEDWSAGRLFSRDKRPGCCVLQRWSVPGEAIERFISGSRTVTYAPGAGLLAWRGRAVTVWSSDQPRRGAGEASRQTPDAPVLAFAGF